MSQIRNVVLIVVFTAIMAVFTSIFGQLLWTIIIPVLMPIAAVMSIVGSYSMFKLMNNAKTRKRIFI
jgi:glucan phosphoethanolaminetransferase (alkaline phosphatase superfamily)